MVFIYCEEGFEILYIDKKSQIYIQKLEIQSTMARGIVAGKKRVVSWEVASGWTKVLSSSLAINSETVR